MSRIELTKDAERDLIDIYLYSLAEFGEHQADRYADTLHKGLDRAAANPSFGADYGFVQPGLFRYEIQSHAAYYRQIADGIRVLRILHGRMDPHRHMG